MNENEKINYLEIPAKDLKQTRLFFESVFGWVFNDFGPDYTAFSQAGINGGFYRSEHCATTDNGSVLIVFYSIDLKQTQTRIVNSGGSIVKAVFSFPGGRRFHFSDPNGNEYAVWSDK